MGYKLIAVDIDGTLLDSNGNISTRTKKAIDALIKQGGIFTIASGRPIQGLDRIRAELQLDLPYITYNGAMVVMGNSKEILYEKRLSQEQTTSIVELGTTLGTTIIVWRENKLFTNRKNEQSENYRKLTNTDTIVVEDQAVLAGGGATKVLWYDSVEHMEELQQQVCAAGFAHVNWHTSQPYFLEFVHEEASKAIAMEKLGQHYGILREEMIAVGDGFNDLSMIEYAGLGVAMGNAQEQVKQRAGYVTASNDQDGVAKVIEEFMLQ